MVSLHNIFNHTYILSYLEYIFTVIEYTFRYCTIRIHIMHYFMPVNFFTEPGQSSCECSQDTAL